MSTIPNIRYELDPTGINPDNAVAGEEHTLNTLQIRSVAPNYGPFFSESVVIIDDATGQPLVPGVQYKFVELNQAATLHFGKEICEVILITDQTVSNTIILNYQVLGGLYTRSAVPIANMYEAIMQDDRPVDWANVLNKPDEYPPSLHNHLLQDIVGFEALVVELERIRNAIVLSDVPAFEAVIDWVRTYTANLPTVSYVEIDNVTSNNKFVTFEKLLYSLQRLNFNGFIIDPVYNNVNEGNNLSFTITATNWIDNANLYWTIEHITTTNSDFMTTSGIINMSGNRGAFNFTIATNPGASEGNEEFRVALRKNSPSGPVLARTGIITINMHDSIGIDEYIDYRHACCMISPDIEINPISFYMIEQNNR